MAISIGEGILEVALGLVSVLVFMILWKMNVTDDTRIDAFVVLRNCVNWDESLRMMKTPSYPLEVHGAVNPEAAKSAKRVCKTWKR